MQAAVAKGKQKVEGRSIIGVSVLGCGFIVCESSLAKLASKKAKECHRIDDVTKVKYKRIYVWKLEKATKITGEPLTYESKVGLVKWEDTTKAPAAGPGTPPGPKGVAVPPWRTLLQIAFHETEVPLHTVLGKCSTGWASQATLLMRRARAIA